MPKKILMNVNKVSNCEKFTPLRTYFKGTKQENPLTSEPKKQK